MEAYIQLEYYHKMMYIPLLLLLLYILFHCHIYILVTAQSLREEDREGEKERVQDEDSKSRESLHAVKISKSYKAKVASSFGHIHWSLFQILNLHNLNTITEVNGSI